MEVHKNESVGSGDSFRHKMLTSTRTRDNSGSLGVSLMIKTLVALCIKYPPVQSEYRMGDVVNVLTGESVVK